MCGRTALTASPQELRELFGLSEEPRIEPHFNVTPSQPIAVVRVVRVHADVTVRKMELRRWGLVPFWASDPKIGRRLALARIETASTAPAFRDAVRKRRCLVVVDGFYEWKRDGKRRSQPFFFHRGDGAPFALAGVWDRWASKDGEVVESCAILTQPARPPVDAVHDRMPVVLGRDGWDRWLDLAVNEPSSQLTPRDADLVVHAVSSRVNDPKNDDASCVAPVEPEQTSLF